GPPLPVVEIPRAELPVLVRVRESLLETRLLFVARDMEEELQNHDAAGGEHPLELVDVPVSLGPLLLLQLPVHPWHQDVFVMRAVEDPDNPLRGDNSVDAPEKIVTLLELRRRLEGGNAAPLRIHRREHLANGAILSRRV